MPRKIRERLTATAPDMAITPRAFLARFTRNERRAIQLAAQHDPAANNAKQREAAELRDLLLEITVSQFIDLNSAATRAGVAALEAVGLVAGGRATSILDAAPAKAERPDWW